MVRHGLGYQHGGEQDTGSSSQALHLRTPLRDRIAHRPRPPRSLDATALVFANSLGNTDLHWTEKDFPEAVAGVEIKDFCLHDTRHTFASRLAMEGVDLLTLKELGGWKTLRMVQRYGHLSPRHQRQAIERLVTRVVAVARPAEAAGGVRGRLTYRA